MYGNLVEPRDGVQAVELGLNLVRWVLVEVVAGVEEVEERVMTMAG